MNKAIENGNDTFSGIRINPDEYKKEELVENDFVCKNNKMTIVKVFIFYNQTITWIYNHSINIKMVNFFFDFKYLIE